MGYSIIIKNKCTVVQGVSDNGAYYAGRPKAAGLKGKRPAACVNRNVGGCTGK